MEMETAFHFHAATMTATDLFLLQLWLPAVQVRSPRVATVRPPSILPRAVIGAFLFAASPDPTRAAQNGAAKDTISACDLTSFWSVFCEDYFAAACGGGYTFICRAD